MAPDSFESDHLPTDGDLSGQPETMMQEPRLTAPRPARRSLFQIVCIDGAPMIEPPAIL